MPKGKPKKVTVASLVKKHTAFELAKMYLAASSGSAADATLEKIRKLLGAKSSSTTGGGEGKPKVEEVIQWLKSSGEKANSATIKEKTGISAEDWTATAPLLKERSDISTGGKGQGKWYKVK